MLESKTEVETRLRSDGRWGAFVRRREELKVQGLSPGEAWRRAGREFPPIGVRPSDEPANTIDLSVLKGKPPVPVTQAVRWAFEHLDADWIGPADAPSPGAWGLRNWARSSQHARSQFYRLFASKLPKPPRDTFADEEAAKQREKERRLLLFGHLKPDPESNRGASAGSASVHPPNGAPLRAAL